MAYPAGMILQVAPRHSNPTNRSLQKNGGHSSGGNNKGVRETYSHDGCMYGIEYVLTYYLP